MALRVDFKNTKYAVSRAQNKALDSWYPTVSMGLYFVGMNGLTWENLSKFIVRYSVLCAVQGMRSPFDTDPTLLEPFVGITTNVVTETDAAFFRRAAKAAKALESDLTKRWEVEGRQEKFFEQWQREYERGYASEGP